MLLFDAYLAKESTKIRYRYQTDVGIVIRMGLLKKVKDKTEETAKRAGQATEKVGKEGVELGKKGVKETEEAAKKLKKKL
jgi:hypothetical protein